MARSFSFPVSRFEGFRISPSDIQVNWEDNGRAFPYELADVTDLLGDLRAGRDYHSPLVVKPVKLDDGGRGVKLVAGYRRLYAALEFVQESPDFKVPVIVEEPEDEKATLILNVRENVARKDLNHIDRGHVIERFQALGMDKKEIAETLEISDAQVGQLLRLVTELSERIQFLVKGGQITADDAFAILAITDPDAREAFVTSLLAEKSESSIKPPTSNKKTVREKVREAGGNVGAVRLPEFKRYLSEIVDTDGPGSNKGQVELCKSLLEYMSGKLAAKQLDIRFEKFCRAKVV